MSADSDCWKMPIESDLECVKTLIGNATTHENKDVESMMKYAVEPYGKMIRPSMCILAYYACGGDSPDNIQKFAAAAELLHTSTLIHDDINDKSDYRRGQPSMFKRFGAKKSIIIGDMLMINAFALVKNEFQKYSNFAQDIAFGLANSEFEQMRNEFNVDISEEDYIGIISGKTAIFFSQCAKIGALNAGSDQKTTKALEKFGLLYGIGFQIADDILDVTGSPDETGKSVGIDLREGKMTLPTILAMRDPLCGETIRNKIKEHDDFSEVLDLIRKTGSIDRCTEMTSTYCQRAIEELSILPESQYKDSLIQLTKNAMNRSS